MFDRTERKAVLKMLVVLDEYTWGCHGTRGGRRLDSATVTRALGQLFGRLGKSRDEWLNEEVFWSEKHAQVVVERWRRDYNKRWPNSALGYQEPRRSRNVQEESRHVYR